MDLVHFLLVCMRKTLEQKTFAEKVSVRSKKAFSQKKRVHIQPKYCLLESGSIVWRIWNRFFQNSFQYQFLRLIDFSRFLILFDSLIFQVSSLIYGHINLSLMS